MAVPDVGAIADDLLRHFMAPLVLGGPMSPGRPIGAKVALTLGASRVSGDPDLLSHIALARTRIARALVPLDRLGDTTPAEWALGAALHDIVQSAHPSFGSRSSGRLLDLVAGTLERIGDAATLGEAVSRHTWFSRVFEITRSDTVVSWWVGSRTFLGEDPPERLMSWPDLRRVRVVKSTRSLTELPVHGGHVDPARLLEALSRFLTKTPLTDLMTCTRAAPAFVFTPPALALLGAPFGRTLARHAVARGDTLATDRALGRAVRALFAAKAWGAASIASSFLGERLLMEALLGAASTAAPGADNASDAAFGRAVGALAAKEMVRRGEVQLGDEEQRRVLSFLEGPASVRQASELFSATASSSAP